MLQFLTVLIGTLFFSGAAHAAPSSFQRSCSDIRIERPAGDVAIVATCRDRAGRNQPADLYLNGYHNIDGQLMYDGRGKSSFQRSCDRIDVRISPDRVFLTAQCRTRNQAVRQTSIEVQDVQNIDGRLTLTFGGMAPPPRVVQAPPPPPPPQPRRPAPGQSFYVNTEGADVPSLCIDIAGGQLRAGTPIMLWQCHQQAPQRFGLNPSMGLVYVAAVNTLCVDGGAQQQLQLVDCHAVRTRWRYDPRSNTIRSDQKLCWDIRGGNIPANIRQRAAVLAWPCHNGVNQQFVLND